MTSTTPNPALPSERHPMSKPQIFVHLEFGVSWSQRHTPRTHAMTYTSRNLRSSRERGAFPRQLPPPNTNFLAASDTQPHRPREHGEQSSRHHHQQHSQYPQHQGPQRRRHDSPRDHDRSQRQPRDQTREQRHQRRESRSDSRGLSHERGKSAPPPFHDSPWDTVPGPSASLFPTVPQPATMAEDEGRQLLGKPLPEPPSKFRLGEDGLPWSAWAWPAEPFEQPQGETDDYGEGPAFNSNRLTAVATSQERPRSHDPERVRELESLSAAMMTVDNGFENQWWYQGPRENTGWWPRDQEEPSRLSLADPLLLSAVEPMSSIAPLDGWYAPTLDNDRSSLLDGIVSPISTLSSPTRPLQRTMTTRSEELFFGSSL